MADKEDRVTPEGKQNASAPEKKKSGENTAKNVLIQGTILAAASIIAKVIGLIYRIPLFKMSETVIILRQTRFIPLS